MSQNIECEEIDKLEASMDARDIVRLYREFYDCGELPEICFLNEEAEHNHVEDAFDLLLDKSTTDYTVKLQGFEWSGTWSGNSYDFLCKTVAPLIKGHVKVKFLWEGIGHIPFEVKDGVVKKR